MFLISELFPKQKVLNKLQDNLRKIYEKEFRDNIH